MRKKARREKERIIFLRLFVFLILLFFSFSFQKVLAQWGNFSGEKIKFIEAISNWNSIFIEWEKNEYLSETETLILVRKELTCPKDIFDGEEIYRGNGNYFEDKKAERDKEYCYGVGILNLSGEPSSFKTSQLVKFLDWKENIVIKLTDKLNLIIILEILFLIYLFFRKKFKKQFSIN